MELDVLIFGGGGAGLWLLDELHRRGFGALLMERTALGTGQTIACQGILHGGLKYSLAGALTDSAKAIRNLPALWRQCLQGHRPPDLTRTTVLSPCCYLWRTQSVKSKLGIVGARIGLQCGAHRVSAESRPAVLAACPGDVFRVDEQVIDVASFLRDLADQHRDRLFRISPDHEVTFVRSSWGRVDRVRVTAPDPSSVWELSPRTIVFAAGAGNAELRERAGLSADAMQRRPLHMVLVRGELPDLFGHCVDGAKTRVTITTARDGAGRVVWQVGGQLSETGVRMESSALLEFARKELQAVLPGVSFAGAEWSTYRIDRAEVKTDRGLRPAGAVLQQERSVITAWPTKFVLVPELARMIADRLPDPSSSGGQPPKIPDDWPRPDIALTPWEAPRQWRK